MRREPSPPSGAEILIACSGGSDSTALAALAAAAAPLEHWSFGLVHLDHGLRPGSTGEASLVEQLAGQIGFDFQAQTLPVAKLREEEGGNLEDLARRLRYETLDRIARERRCGWVLMGHTADDLAETLWLWLLRGTGLRGLSPMPARRPLQPGSPVTLLRPMLDCRREELQAYLRRQGVPWLEDPSNQDLKLRRNRLRHHLLPLIKDEFGLDPVPAAARLTRQAGEIGRFLDDELGRRGYPAADLVEGNPALDRAKLKELPEVLAAWFLSSELERLGQATQDAVERILAMNRELATGKILDLAGGLRARFTDRAIVLESGAEAPEAPAGLPQASLPKGGLTLPESGNVFLDGGWVLRIERRAAPPERPEGDLSAHFDVERLSLPLRLANPLPGQRIRPLGGPGSRKLSDLFIDRKVPQPFRERVPILLDAEDCVLWVPGLARGENAPISESTRMGLCLDLSRSS